MTDLNIAQRRYIANVLSRANNVRRLERTATGQNLKDFRFDGRVHKEESDLDDDEMNALRDGELILIVKCVDPLVLPDQFSVQFILMDAFGTIRQPSHDRWPGYFRQVASLPAVSVEITNPKTGDSLI